MSCNSELHKPTVNKLQNSVNWCWWAPDYTTGFLQPTAEINITRFTPVHQISCSRMSSLASLTTECQESAATAPLSSVLVTQQARSLSCLTFLLFSEIIPKLPEKNTCFILCITASLFAVAILPVLASTTRLGTIVVEKVTGGKCSKIVRETVFHTTPRNIPQECRSHQHRGGSLKLRFFATTRSGAGKLVTWHTRRFAKRAVGRGGRVAWPPRSPDLTHLHYCLWGHLKALLFETKVGSWAAQRRRIFAVAEHNTQPSGQNCGNYPVSIDAGRKMHSNLKRTLWTITVKQYFIRQAVYQNTQSVLNKYFNTAGHSCAM
jgi:hypothetical protein